ncbi:MAG: hypothetical protein ABSF61_08405 [Anaerolineales bacterium]
MKEQIISVEPNDDLASLRDKVLRAQASLVLLHAASPCPAIRRRLDLVLVRRWAISVGSSLALATSVRPIRTFAKETQIPCFPTLQTALRASRGALPSPAPEMRKPPHSRGSGKGQDSAVRVRAAAPPGVDEDLLTRYLFRSGAVKGFGSGRFRILAFSAGIGLLLLPFFLGVPSAIIRLQLPTRTVVASTLLPKSSGAGLIAQVQVSGRRLSSGEEVVPTQSASGSVLLRNKSPDTLLLPPGLQIQAPSSRMIFVTSSPAAIAPNQKLWIGVHAAQAGIQGNLPAGSLGMIAGPLGLILEVSDSSVTSGGQSERRAVVTVDDLQSLRMELEGELRSQALLQLEAEAPSGSLLVRDSLTTEGPVESQADAAPGTPVDSVGMTLSAKAMILSFNSSDLERIATQALSERIGRGEALDLSQMGMTLSGTPSGDAILDVEAKAYPALDPSGFPYQVRLQRPRDADRIIQSHIPLGITPEIEISPSWLPFLPLYPWRIHVEAQPS